MPQDDVWQDLTEDVWQDVVTDVWQDLEQDVVTFANQHKKGLLLHVY